ncbi:MULTISPECIES: FimV/HubP family polar landmark protein [unclassified Herbaspirillum]|uniref:FimV/HubP family polar landmark protein n=1 Tax=unclassified Herbaspirillum TaxID=2624150 RepID=UPI0011545934|nr:MULTISPECIES: FimV/HubP family polar landmark protein [unclassified Herbaspirillum]MBB5391920.1 pilus assembly protein FimV [Herbaspirillum sp. SJZ102]TQK13380.1 pilus assembly protein FimV [Herbaspirillum sp. SJZ130]TQK15384.1 pilus assembly protein FimV [Herbaspirillum sp. SJZ106]
MPLNTNKTLPLSQIKKLSAALALALAIPLGAHAAGLGKLTVLSSLGQPLRAEIEVTSVGADEADKLSAKLASAEAFSRANVDYNPILSSLSFAVEQRQGRHFIRISSSQPVSEPFVDLLLELSAGNSKLVREYTFLLDPADSKTPRNAQVAPLTPGATAAKAESTPAAASEAPSPALQQVVPARPAPTTVAAEATPAPAARAQIPASGEEPATTIVQRPAPSALAEELIRRQQASPAATPESASPGAVPVAAGQAASGEVARPAAGKAAEYRVKQGDTLAGIALRNKQANVSLDQMLIALYRANPDAFMGNNINRLRAGHILALPDQPTASAVDQDEAHGMVVAQAQDFNAYRNKLAAQVANAPAGKPGADRRSAGGKITTRVEERSGTASAKDRLELSRANGGKGNTGNAGSAEEKAAAERALSEANDRVKELEKNVSDLQKLLEMKNKAIADLSEQQKPADAAQAAPAPDAAKPGEKPAEPEAAPAPAAPAPATPAVPAPAKPESKSGFIDSVRENPYILAGVGGAAALLVAALGVVGLRRRKKKAEEPAAEDAAEPEPASAPPAAATAAVAEADAAVDAEPVPPAAAEEPAAEAAPAEEEGPVDPIAEADMYIAYGRDEQAEDILKLALQTQPERQALHSKLLEIYAKRQDVDSFNKVALDLHQLSGGLNEAWVKAASLGIVLDPTNPLYGGTPEAPAAPEPEEPGMEFDLSDFKGAEIQPSAAMPAVDLGKDIDFDLDLENGAKPDDNEPILPASTSASSLLDSGDDAKPAMSLADLDLDLPAEPPAPPPSANLLEEDEESAFEAEMTTKLDLAAAYQEIGDKEGARELLEEVTRGGNDAQVARAKDMLSKLA